MKKNRQKIIYWLLAAAVCMGIPARTWADPSCEVQVKDAGPPLTVEFKFQDAQVGLKSIVVKESDNFFYNNENFLPGETDPVVYTFIQQAGTTDPYAEVEATNMNDQTTICTYPGTDPPQCSVQEDPGPPFTVTFEIVDKTEGLQSISTQEQVNADVDIPSFTAGTTQPVFVTAEKIDASDEFAVSLNLADTVGNQDTCSFNQDAPEPPQPPQDTQDPQVILTDTDTGPPIILEITAQDRQSGIQTIEETETINAVVQIPSFTAGTTDPVKVTATQQNAQFDFTVEIEVVDRSGNTTTFRYQTSNNQTRPEIDLVGRDDQYFFEDDWTGQIFSNGRDAAGNRINNRFSDFQTEYFDTNAGQPNADSCYSSSNNTYLSVLTPTWTEAAYEWEIVLQMEPAADLILELHGCVLKTGEVDVWKAAYQTGFYTTPWNETVFLSTANPRLTVMALPGPMAKEDFPAEGFILDTKKQTGLQVEPLEDSLITVQTFLSESIVIALPSEGSLNSLGQTTHSLSSGDRIKVTIEIPGNSTADLRLGEDGAAVQYVGKIGTEYTNQ